MVDLHKSIVISCDTYYYGLAQDLGIDAIARFMAQFGFGSRTGIDIAGEVAGHAAVQEWKMERFKQKWFAGDTISVGIGQGYNPSTPLAACAGDRHAGQRRRGVPAAHRRQIEDSRTRERVPIEPSPLRTLELKPENVTRDQGRDGRRQRRRHRGAGVRRGAVRDRAERPAPPR